ncbi:unnamed protein product [Arabidopsis halleri]
MTTSSSLLFSQFQRYINVKLNSKMDLPGDYRPRLRSVKPNCWV